MHLLAARVWRARGYEVPLDLQRQERLAAMVAMAAPKVLERVRAAYDGQLMLMKGPEVAKWYRHPSDRPFNDLDLLADDPPAAQAALIQAGFIEVGDTEAYRRDPEHPHLCPLAWPGIPVSVELHRRPSQPSWLPRVDVQTLFAASRSSVTGVEGLLAPARSAHALLLVAHGWAHAPLGRLADLVDVAAVMAGGSRHETDDLARRWGWERMWRITVQASDAILAGTARSSAVSVWARHLPSLRERALVEKHFAGVAAPACTLPAAPATLAVAAVLGRTVGSHGDERWTHKLRRFRVAVAHAFAANSEHERAVGSRGT
jgi:hypothetical protein